MKWLNKMERKFGRFAIPNLMMIIIIGQGMVFLADMLNPAIGLNYLFSLSRSAILHGEIWRLFTFIFIPPTNNLLGLVFTLYLYYLIGNTLENEWGDFKFNVYYLCGIFGAILAAMVTGSGVNFYLNLSLFLAFAIMYPDHELLLFFVIPVKMKYLAYMAGVYYILMVIVGSFAVKAAIVFSLANFLLFFGGDFMRYAKQEIKYYKTRKAWRDNNNNNNNRW
ncbi:MAG: hypothetical protein RR508_02865 [Oscillospiraceae bacterium]